MADMVSFKMAPALVAYNRALADLGKIGWRGKVNFIVILLVVGVFVVVSVQPALILCIGFYLNAISGPIITIRTVRKLKVAHVAA